MDFSLDERIDTPRVNQFASQIDHVDVDTMSWIRQHFSGEHTVEFYEGLLSGFCSMYVLVNNLPIETLKQYTGPLVAYIADHLKKIPKE